MIFYFSGMYTLNTQLNLVRYSNGIGIRGSDNSDHLIIQIPNVCVAWFARPVSPIRVEIHQDLNPQLAKSQ